MNWQQKIKRFLTEDDRRVAFLINLKCNLDAVAVFLNELSQRVTLRTLVVFFGLETPKQFAQKKLNIKSSEDYLSREVYEEIDRYVFEGSSKDWYTYRDTTDYRGIPLGKMFEYDFQKYLVPRIKNLEIMRKINDAEKMQRIIVLDDSDELIDVARLWRGIFGTPILTISFNRSRRLPTKLGLILKTKLSYILSNFLDRLALKKIKSSKDYKGLILIDAKFSKFLKFKVEDWPFLLCPLERGAKIRVDIIKQGLSYLPLNFAEDRRFSKEYVSYRKNWQNLLFDRNFKDVFKYKDISILELVHKKLSVFFLESIPRIISNINLLEKMFREQKIKVVVLRNDVKELERTIIFSSRLTKIPTLVVQHGILAETNGHNVLLADKYAAWGRASAEWYGRFGNVLEKFEVTGNPRFDKLINWQPKISRQELCERLNLDSSKGIILFVTQQINKFSSFWIDDLFWVMADKLLWAMRQFPERQLIIKADPYESLDPYKERIQTSSHNNAVAVKNLDIYTLIFLSELVITLDSTVALEAMIFDKPVITFNLLKRQDRVPFAEKGAAIGVYNERDLTSTIKKVLTDGETILQLKNGRASFLKEYASVIDGKACERILNLCRNYVKS